MSHFTVLVITDEEPTEAVLERALLPFHEYECTEIEAYLQWVAYSDHEENYTAHAKPGQGREDFARDWYGEHVEFRDGVPGRMTNPNRKWDCWAVGGRWSGMLVNQHGERCNTCQVKHLNHAAMAAQRLAARVERWSRYCADLARGMKPGHAALIHGIKPETTREQYVNTDPGFSTFAVLKDGVWHEKGRMGWFALVSDEKENWQGEFADLASSARPDQWFTIVDCHI